jgi:RNA polymerase sigma factor (sigma-70 family)
MSSSQVNETLDHLFRRQSGQIVAYLTRIFGPGKIDFAENIVQEALLKATQVWPIQGIPENPAGWITKVAKNIAIDHLRKDKYLAFDSETYESLAEKNSIEGKDKGFDQELRDDQLKLFFVCCHPILSRETRVALTLKTVCGFSVPEIAKAFLSNEVTVAQRIVRAKQRIADEKLKFEIPPPEHLEERLDSVLDVLYLLFNEGYLASEGDQLLRKDLCKEAISRTTALSDHPIGNRPKVFALLALMHFQFSRFDTRVNPEGDLLLLEDQDRRLWSQEDIEAGLRFLDRSAEGEDLTDYHLQAGIASCHALAPTYAETNWEQILGHYDILLEKNHSPIVALNRAVAVAMVHGPQAGLDEIDRFKELPPMKAYYLLHGTQAELYRKLGNRETAKKLYEKALQLTGTAPERRLISKRIEECEGTHASK